LSFHSAENGNPKKQIDLALGFCREAIFDGFLLSTVLSLQKKALKIDFVTKCVTFLKPSLW
jgi:hypothetical protein